MLITGVYVQEEKHIFYNKIWYSLLIRHLLAQRYKALEEVGDNQSKPKGRLDKSLHGTLFHGGVKEIQEKDKNERPTHFKIIHSETKL